MQPSTSLCVHHLCYGFRVASNCALPGVLHCSEPGPVDLQLWLTEEEKFASAFPAPLSHIVYTSQTKNRNGEHILQVGVFENDRFFGFFYADGARFAIERQGRHIWASWPENYALEDACTYLVGPVIAFALRLCGFTCLHASSVVVGGRAIVLLGQPGAGKSTTAAAFATLGHSILSDDMAVVVDRDDQFQIQPGYPRINLWPDSVHALFGSEEALPQITPTWSKRYLSLDQNGYQFQSEAVPLGVVYLLTGREPGLTAPVVEKLEASEAFMTLVANTCVNYLLNADMRHREFDVLGRVTAAVPIRRVRTAAGPSMLFDLCEALVADATKQMANQDNLRIEMKAPSNV